MSSLIYRINAFSSRVVSRVPIGTNLGLFHLLWMLLSGRFLAAAARLSPKGALVLPLPAGTKGIPSPPPHPTGGRTGRENTGETLPHLRAVLG